MTTQITLDDFWYAKFSSSNIKKSEKAMKKQVRVKLKADELPKRLEVIWKFTKDSFREFVIADDVAYMNFVIPCRQANNVYEMSIPLLYDKSHGIYFMKFTNQNYQHLIFEGRKLPLNYHKEPKTISLDIAIFSGILKRVCCAACWEVHDRLGIHHLDWMCCLGNCFTCSLIPWV